MVDWKTMPNSVIIVPDDRINRVNSLRELIDRKVKEMAKPSHWRMLFGPTSGRGHAIKTIHWYMHGYTPMYDYDDMSLNSLEHVNIY